MSRRAIRSRARVAVMAFALLVLAAWPGRCAEPVYDGRPLSDWLLSEHNEAQTNAIRQIGTNAIPTLLDILGAKQRTARRVAGRLQNPGLQAEMRSKDADVDEFRSLAVIGFAALGTNAEPAIPRIAKLLYDGETVFQASRALIKVGPKGFLALTNAMATHEDIRPSALLAISQEGGAAPNTVDRMVLEGLHDPDWTVRGNSAYALEGKDPAVAIPALISVLDDAEYYPRSAAADALSSYGPTAKAAAPKMLSMFTNVVTSPDRQLARDLGVTLLAALRKIDRDAAGQAETFLVNSGPLNDARIGYTTTLLRNGKQLIAGGSIHTEIPSVKNRVVPSAELIDPKTGRWAETGEMHAARVGHAAVLMADGKVLVIGGLDHSEHALASAELYDPATGDWSETGSLHFGRFFHTAVLRQDGSVVVSGGNDDRNPVSAQEAYNPAAGTWAVITNQASK